MNHDDPVLTEQQLFEYLRYERGLVCVTRRSVKYAVMRREIEPYQISCKNWFSRAQADAWIESRKTPSQSPEMAARHAAKVAAAAKKS